MGFSGIISAIVVGAIIGALARLIKPGRQNISVILTIIVGILAAFLGSLIANALGRPTDSFDFITLIIQLVLAVIGVGIVAGSKLRSR